MYGRKSERSYNNLHNNVMATINPTPFNIIYTGKLRLKRLIYGNIKLQAQMCNYRREVIWTLTLSWYL